MKNIVQNPKYCFSYIRYSSEGQRGGSSVERQAEVAPRIATQKGWILKEEFNIKQEAVSAYKKHNFPKLMAIIGDAKKGVFPQGTVCIVEAIDRLTRATLDEGREMLRQMLLAGIEICDNEGNHYTKDDLNDIVKLITLCLKIVAANEYATRLSNRMKEAYRLRSNKILNGEVILKTKEGTDRRDIPAWVSINGKGFELNAKAEIMASIFKMYLDGIGPAAIARKFNQEKILSLGGQLGKWSQSVIYRLLSDRRVIGETKVNGDTVKGYFPAAVLEDSFLRAQAKLNVRKEAIVCYKVKKDAQGKKITDARGNFVYETDEQGKKVIWKKIDRCPKSTVLNLFSGVAYCTCGEKIKVSSGSSTGGKYISCYGHLKGLGCSEPMIKYQPFESAFTCILRLNPKQLLRDENGEALNVQTQILKGRLSENAKESANITEALGIKVTKALVIRQSELETQAEEIKRQIELESAKTVAVKGGMDRLAEIMENISNLEADHGLRIQVQAWIRENVNKITLNKRTKEFTVDLKSGNCITMDFCGNIKGTKSLETLFKLSNPKQSAVAV